MRVTAACQLVYTFFAALLEKLSIFTRAASVLLGTM